MAQQRLKSHAVTLGVASSAVVRKASEFCRMLDAKGQSFHKQLNLVGDAKLFICLNIAAVEYGQSFDKSLAIKKSSMARRNYESALKSLQTLLSVNKTFSVRDCAVTRGHPQLVNHASSLVKQYLDTYLAGDTSLVTTAVNMAALVVAAKQEGITLKATKVIEMAGCNRASFDKLKKQIELLTQKGNLKKDENQNKTEEMLAQPVRASPRKHKSTTNGMNEVSEKRIRPYTAGTADPENTPSDNDSFQIWRCKILANARKRTRNELSISHLF